MNMLLFYIIFMEVLAMVQGECVPRDSLRVRDREMALHESNYLRCSIDNVCKKSQSFIYYKCDINGDSCKKILTYFFANDSISIYDKTNRSIETYHAEEYFFDINIENVQTSDDGIWKIYNSSINSYYECVNINVTTYVLPKEGKRIIPFQENVPTYKKFNLTCLVNEIRPAYRLFMFINGLEFRSGVQIDTPNGDTWNISFSVELVLSPHNPLQVRCLIDELFKDWMYSDVFVINPLEDNLLTFHPLEAAVIGCAIPINYSFIGWTKNNVPVSDSHILTKTRTTEVRGFFNFIDSDVTTVQFNELQLFLPSLDHGCGPINEYIGRYACDAIHLEIGENFKSAPRLVVVEYAPTLEWTQSNRFHLSTLPGANVISVCPLYSYPPVKSYTWLKGSIQLGNKRTLMIPFVTESSFGQYTCIATNTMGSTNVTINVIKIVEGKANVYKANINQQVILECPLCDDSEEECKWEITDERTVHKGRVYKIETVTESDYGKYLCIAVFASGRTWMRIELTNPGHLSIESTTVAVTAVNMISTSTYEDIHHQEGRLLTTEAIAGLTVTGAVMVGMIVTFTVLCCLLLRRHQSKDNANGEMSTNNMNSEETPHIYEKINLAYVNNN